MGFCKCYNNKCDFCNSQSEVISLDYRDIHLWLLTQLIQQEVLMNLQLLLITVKKANLSTKLYTNE